MPAGASFGRLLATATLPRSRELLRSTRGGWLLVTTIALVYGLVSMIVGLMLELGPTNFTTTTVTVLDSPIGVGPWWNFPAILIVAPNAVIALPFFATISMVLVSIGVGIGMGVAVVLSLRLLRRRRASLGRPAGMGAVAGLTPAMIALVTLGACCSTTAAATAGIGLAAQASGTTFGALLVNTWYLGVFQMVILGAALIAQEQLAEVYGFLLQPERARRGTVVAPVDRRYIVSGLLRIGLLAAGVTWGLALLAEWTTAAPSVTSPAAWYSGIFQHLLLAGLAAAGALAPAALARFLTAPQHPRYALLLRIGALVAGLGLLLWWPAAVVAAGAHGLVNEVLGAFGAPVAWGAVTLPGIGGLALALRWAFQFGLLGGFGLAVALVPGRVAALLSSSPTVAAEDAPMNAAAPSRIVAAPPAEDR